jgi:hypothetical protein
MLHNDQLCYMHLLLKMLYETPKAIGNRIMRINRKIVSIENGTYYLRNRDSNVKKIKALCIVMALC